MSAIKYPALYKKHPKVALKQLLKYFLIPHLEKIENAVEKQCEEFQNSLYTVSEMTLKLIVYNDDT